MLQMIHSLHLHRLKTDHADNKLVCNLSVLGKTDLLQICCRSAGFVRDVALVNKLSGLLWKTTLFSKYQIVRSSLDFPAIVYNLNNFIGTSWSWSANLDLHGFFHFYLIN